MCVSLSIYILEWWLDIDIMATDNNAFNGEIDMTYLI